MQIAPSVIYQLYLLRSMNSWEVSIDNTLMFVSRLLYHYFALSGNITAETPNVVNKKLLFCLYIVKYLLMIDTKHYCLILYRL